MKVLLYILIFLIGCNNFKNSNTEDKKTVPISIKDDSQCQITYRKLDKLFIVGDFNGDGIRDTIYQNTISRLNNSDIDSFPDNNWDSIVDYFYKMESDIILTFSKKHIDTLHFGTGLGLFCLINIGDNNLDGKDEIAIVIHNCDFSNLNSCRIYTICNMKWTELFSFGVHEFAFIYDRNSKPIFTNIPDYLEKIDGKWNYSDYYDQEWNEDESLKKHVLILNDC